MGATWTTAAALSLDHLSILVGFQCEFVKSTSDNHTTNFRKANWEGFESDTEDAFAALPLPRDVRVGKCVFSCTLVKVAAKDILAGRIHKVYPFFK